MPTANFENAEVTGPATTAVDGTDTVVTFTGDGTYDA
jgi:hypothetical protein